MKENKVTSEWQGVTITYNERTNQWDFELRGRQRSAESLRKAQEIIDRPVKLTKKNSFARVQAWRVRYGKLEEVTITSIAAPGWGGQRVNVSFTENNRPQRDKQDPSQLFPRNEENDKWAAEYQQTTLEIQRLKDHCEQLVKKMKCYVPPDPEPEEPEKK